jgi:hypothetical protein
VAAAGVGAAAGIGTYAYVKGNLKGTVDASLDDTFDATTKAVKNLELVEKDSRKDAFEAAVTARSADDKDVTINLKKTGERTTRVEIRVGVFGDEARSRQIMDEIQKGL